jgi:hypothetical protein
VLVAALSRPFIEAIGGKEAAAVTGGGAEKGF